MKKMFLAVFCAVCTLTVSAQTEAELFALSVKNSPVPSVLMEGKNIFVDKKEVQVPQSIQTLSDGEVMRLIAQKVSEFNSKKNLSPEGMEYVEVNLIRLVPGMYNESFTIHAFYKEGKIDSMKLYSLMPLGHVLGYTNEAKKILAILLSVS